MIGKAEWFSRNDSGEMEIIPRSWQGWTYIAVAIIPLAIFQSIPFFSSRVKIVFTSIWLLFLVIDVVDIISHLKKHEQEVTHKTIAERNSAWFMATMLSLGFIYYMVMSAMGHHVEIEPIIFATLFGGVTVKVLSNFMH